MAKNNNHNNNHIEDFENLIDHAIKEENFKEINEFISQSLNSAVNITKSSINKLFNKTNENRPYRVCDDDNIINQKPKAEKKVRAWSNLAKLSLIFHGIGAISILIDGIHHFDLDSLMVFALYFVPAIIFSLYILYRTDKLKKQIIRFRKYKREIGNNTVIPVMDLAVATSKAKDFTINDLLDLIDKDFFRQARIVENGELLILDSKTYKLYKKEKLNNFNEKNEDLEAYDLKASDRDEILSKARIQITKLANSVDSLKEPMKFKITKLLGTLKRIFSIVKENDVDLKDLSKFIDYYLPTTTKLVETYKDMQDSPTQSVEVSLKEIDKTMDIINEAFLKLLDNMYEDKVIDISSDISVLKTMLKQEGLLDDDFILGGNNAKRN